MSRFLAWGVMGLLLGSLQGCKCGTYDVLLRTGGQHAELHRSFAIDVMVLESYHLNRLDQQLGTNASHDVRIGAWFKPENSAKNEFVAGGNLKEVNYALGSEATLKFRASGEQQTLVVIVNPLTDFAGEWSELERRLPLSRDTCTYVVTLDRDGRPILTAEKSGWLERMTH